MASVIEQIEKFGQTLTDGQSAPGVCLEQSMRIFDDPLKECYGCTSRPLCEEQDISPQTSTCRMIKASENEKPKC